MSGRLIVIPPSGEIVTHIHKLHALNLMNHVRPLMDNGWLERVKVRYEGRIRDAYVDEDGVSKGLPLNKVASDILAPIYQGQSILGPMVVWVPDKRPASRKGFVDVAVTKEMMK